MGKLRLLLELGFAIIVSTAIVVDGQKKLAPLDVVVMMDQSLSLQKQNPSNYEEYLKGFITGVFELGDDQTVVTLVKCGVTDGSNMVLDGSSDENEILDKIDEIRNDTNASNSDTKEQLLECVQFVDENLCNDNWTTDRPDIPNVLIFFGDTIHDKVQIHEPLKNIQAKFTVFYLRLPFPKDSSKKARQGRHLKGRSDTHYKKIVEVLLGRSESDGLFDLEINSNFEVIDGVVKTKPNSDFGGDTGKFAKDVCNDETTTYVCGEFKGGKCEMQMKAKKAEMKAMCEDPKFDKQCTETDQKKCCDEKYPVQPPNEECPCSGTREQKRNGAPEICKTSEKCEAPKEKCAPTTTTTTAKSTEFAENGSPEGQKADPTEEGMSAGAIAGVTIGIILVLLIIVAIIVAVVILSRRKEKAKKETKSAKSDKKPTKEAKKGVGLKEAKKEEKGAGVAVDFSVYSAGGAKTPGSKASPQTSNKSVVKPSDSKSMAKSGKDAKSPEAKSMAKSGKDAKSPEAKSMGAKSGKTDTKQAPGSKSMANKSAAKAPESKSTANKSAAPQSKSMAPKSGKAGPAKK